MIENVSTVGVARGITDLFTCRLMMQEHHSLCGGDGKGWDHDPCRVLLDRTCLRRIKPRLVVADLTRVAFRRAFALHLFLPDPQSNLVSLLLEQHHRALRAW
jgi:hypothetical protein